MGTNLEDIDVLILCGGLGKRIQQKLPDTPKSLAPIGSTVFLEILLRNLQEAGFRRVILLVGHLKEKIKSYSFQNFQLEVLFSEEKRPLGTGGALKNAKKLIKSEHFLLMNGDSLCEVDFVKLSKFHKSHKSIASIVVTPNNTRKDGGNIKLKGKRIVSFNEKSLYNTDTFINAGIYLMNKQIFLFMPNKNSFSLEYDLFPKVVKSDCFGYVVDSELIDIGTPERYKKAINMFSKEKL